MVRNPFGEFFQTISEDTLTGQGFHLFSVSWGQKTATITFASIFRVCIACGPQVFGRVGKRPVMKPLKIRGQKLMAPLRVHHLASVSVCVDFAEISPEM